ncbi:hypothetical protein DFH09DRAFT_1104339 [Mycena vulgaris]|nr:hypothetical protein DFH09DRAFT_1104339 [Mycena vulgaris]
MKDAKDGKRIAIILDKMVRDTHMLGKVDSYWGTFCVTLADLHRRTYSSRAGITCPGKARRCSSFTMFSARRARSSSSSRAAGAKMSESPGGCSERRNGPRLCPRCETRVCSIDHPNLCHVPHLRQHILIGNTAPPSQMLHSPQVGLVHHELVAVARRLCLSRGFTRVLGGSSPSFNAALVSRPCATNSARLSGCLNFGPLPACSNVVPDLGNVDSTSRRERLSTPGIVRSAALLPARGACALDFTRLTVSLPGWDGEGGFGGGENGEIGSTMAADLIIG